MPGMRNIAIDWYRKVFGAPAGSDIREQGLDTVLDGNTAVALSEAGIATHAVLGGTPPGAAADATWLGEVEHGTNLFGEPLSAQVADGPRGIVAAATGLALAGKRATAFLSGTDLAAAQDLLHSAAGKHAPLVLHVGTRAMAAHGAALGSGHESVHLSADSGFFVLFAANVQEAVDFSYIARRASEASLVPGLVVMDGEQTALAAQDVRLLSPRQINTYLGAAREAVAAPTATQKLLFGDTRRRVPAWHDLDEPALSGALYDRESYALGAAARRPFFDSFVDESLQDAFTEFARKTGRQHAPVSQYRLDDARVVLLAMGSAVETARLAADRLRKQNKIKAGVLGIHTLRPFPGEEVARLLAGRERVVVLERTDSLLSDEPPLTREVRASLARSKDGRHPGCATAVYGLGGMPLRVADLVELATRDTLPEDHPLFLGVAFDDTAGNQPKRDVLLDTLRRAYPDAAALGVVAAKDAPAAEQKGSLTLSIHRLAGRAGESVLADAAALLYRLDHGHVRSRPDVAWERWSGERVDWLVAGNEMLQDPGDGLSADASVDVERGMFRVTRDDATYFVPIDADNSEVDETILGGLFGALVESGLIEHTQREVLSARRNLLAETDATRRDARLAAFQAGLEQVEADDSVDNDGSSPRWQGETPAAVRHLGREDDNFASLPRFWDQAGVLYREGQADRLTADPFFATGTMPPLSSTFNDTSAGRVRLPAFDPSLCTGCGKCWTNCPDSAIGVVAATPAALLDAGISRSGADAVRQVSSKLAPRIISSSRKADPAPATFGEALDEAYTWLKDKMPLAEERKQAIDAGIEGIKAEFGSLPTAITQPFFHDAEAVKKDSAELLSIVINPEACKSCGLCVSNCEPGALSGHEQDAATLQRARGLWNTFSATPDTASETIERASQDAEVGSMASILLSRYCQFAIAGGDPAEAGSGEKIATRLALAATEFHQQPIAQDFAEQLAVASEGLTALINETLAGTLAVDDLDAVTERLKNTTSPRVDVKELADSVAATRGDHSIDTDYLLRLLDLSNRVSEAHHRLVAGKHGLGRARYGLTVAGGTAAAWAGAFPQNPFQAPVLIDMTGDAAQLSAGLVEGHLDETTSLVRLLRLARLEIDKPDGLNWKRAALDKLRWQDLDDDELALCPPLVLVGSDEMLAGQGLGQLIWLLNSKLPVKVLVLSSLDFGLLEAPTNNPRGGLGLLALAQRNAFVAQSSIANASHLGESVLQALRFSGPALIQVYAPSPSRHGFLPKQSVAQAGFAVATRALPLFRYDPEAAGVFGMRISLDGNPDDSENAPRLADWALGQRRFSAHFAPLADNAPAPTALGDWLQLDRKGRRGKTPFIVSTDGDEERRHAVSVALAEATDACGANWQTLLELAGVVTPFTAAVEAEIRAAVAAEHQADLDAQKQASDTEIRELKERTQAEIAGNIRARLLQLAARKRS